MTLVFLDLEETLIDNWDNGFLLLPRVDKTRELLAHLREQGEVRVGLMSWAVWNDRDKTKFVKDLQEFLENNLNCTFDPDLLWSMDDWCKQVWAATGKHVDRADLFDLFGKEEILFTMAKKSKLFENQTVVFVDDTATHNLSVLVPERNCVLKCLNIVAMMLE